MFSPIKWLKPRLKSICVGFGAADMTLVLLSVLGWYFFFDVGYRAQNIYNIKIVGNALTVNSTELRSDKSDRPSDQLRLERTRRACGTVEDEEAIIDRNFAGPAALIGGAMGGYFVLGAMLSSLSVLDHAAARKVISQVCLIGEGVFTVFLILALAFLTSTEDLCPTEYYFEHFQPMAYLTSLTTIFVCAYKAYEVTIIVFYLSDQTKIVEQEDAEVHEHEHSRRNSLNGTRLILPPPSSAPTYTSAAESSRPPTATTNYTTAETDEQQGDQPRLSPYLKNFNKYVEGTTP